MMRRLFLLACLLAPLLAQFPANAATPVPSLRDFVSGSFAQILASHAGQPLVLTFWSLECAHCPTELRTLAKVQKAHPTLKVVTIATDLDADPAVLTRQVRTAGLVPAAQWRFADPVPERLRSEIDPRWWGELPRSYLISARGQRTAMSGTIERKVLERWLAEAR